MSTAHAEHPQIAPDARPVHVTHAEASTGVADAPGPSFEGLALYQFTVEQYERLGECQILDPQDRVFLFDGLLVRKMTKHAPHIIASDNLNTLLVRATPEGWHVSNQNPVVMRPRDEPEPDFKIVRGRPNDYRLRKAGPADVALVIEISDASIRLDQTLMKARYATAKIPEYWIVNLRDGRIQVYTEPTGPDSSPDYRRRRDYGPGEAVPLILEGREVARIAVSDILPPPLDA